MPVTQSAKRALRKDNRRNLVNRRTKAKLKRALDTYKDNPNQDNLNQAYQAVDRAAKKNLLHPNKAARIKSQLSRILPKPKPTPKPSSKPKKTTTNSTSKKSSTTKWSFPTKMPVASFMLIQPIRQIELKFFPKQYVLDSQSSYPPKTDSPGCFTKEHKQLPT